MAYINIYIWICTLKFLHNQMQPTITRNTIRLLWSLWSSNNFVFRQSVLVINNLKRLKIRKYGIFWSFFFLVCYFPTPGCCLLARSISATFFSVQRSKSSTSFLIFRISFLSLFHSKQFSSMSSTLASIPPSQTASPTKPVKSLC